MSEEFFSERADQSAVKARIVSKYFRVWAKIIAARTSATHGKIAYIDLFAGPGRYEDGSVSTPLMVLETAIGEPDLCASLVALFNDVDENHSATLEEEINRIEGVDSLKYPPRVINASIDVSAAEYFQSVSLVPTFSFIDPFGYKGLSSALISSVIKDWGSDCVFFFNYSRINAGVSNEKVFKHMEALFGPENFKRLRERLEGAKGTREDIILEHLVIALKQAGAKHVLTFGFRRGKRLTHHLVFVTKHPLGYELMKEIMAKESSHSDQGVPSFEFAPDVPDISTLFDRPLDDLEDDLVVKFAGRTLRMVDIYHEHNLDRSYIKKNYKAALGNLERDGRISTSKPARPAGTFADAVEAQFPNPPRDRK